MKHEWHHYIGEKYGMLTVIGLAGKNKYNHPLFECQCDCGNKAIIEATRVKNEKTKSCGCLQKEKTKMLTFQHGLTNTRLHRIWAAIISRCENPKNNRYYTYGERGVIICDEWRNDFTNFYNWAMANGYRDDLTIDRIDVNGNYGPSNCRWATRKEQANNKRSNRNVFYNGMTKNLKQWSEYYGFNYKYFQEIMSKNNYSLETILEIPYFKERAKCD